jgi:hypothetical protein
MTEDQRVFERLEGNVAHPDLKEANAVESKVNMP